MPEHLLDLTHTPSALVDRLRQEIKNMQGGESGLGVLSGRKTGVYGCTVHGVQNFACLEGGGVANVCILCGKPFKPTHLYICPSTT